MRSVAHIDVFVASPGDVAEERKILHEAILEINQTWGREYSMFMELIRWETNTFPDFGVDAQDVINKQIPRDYDVFIGIFWSRFGTPTNRAESGTEEEFRNAYDRFRRGGKPRLLIYFNRSKVDPGLVDLDQLKRVQDFRKEISSLGGYYAEYPSVESFRALARAHLAALFQEFKKKIVSDQMADEHLMPIDVGIEKIVDENESGGGGAEEVGQLGFFDILLDSEEKMLEFGRRMTVVAAEMSAFTDRTNTYTRALSAAKTTRERKEIADAFAADTKDFSDKIRYGFGGGFDCLIDGVRGVGNALMAMPVSDDEKTKEGLSVLLSSLESLLPSVNDGFKSLANLQAAVAASPPMTSSFRVARDEFAEVLRQQLNKGETVDILIRDVINLVGKYLG